MKSIFTLIFSLLSVATVYADWDVKFFMDNGEVKCVSQGRVDSISFNEDADEVVVEIGRAHV